MFFAKSSIYPIGLDISDLSLKLVQLQKQGGKIKIQALGRVNLPAGLIVEGEIKSKEKVIEMIKKLIDKPKFGKVSSNKVVACLPETKTFIKLIEIEKNPNELADVIETEIEKHVPLLLDEIFYDWQVIGDKGDKQLVLIGAAPKKIINQYTNLLDEAGLSVEALEIEPMALCRSLLEEETPGFKGASDRNCAIIDIGATRTSLVIYSKNTILFNVSVPISGEKITEDIASSLDIEKGQAEKAKIICGLDEGKAQGVIKKVLSDTINDLNNRVKEAIEFYNNHFSDRGSLNQILICGGGANIKGIDKIIKQAVSLEASRGDALINLGEAKEKFSKLLSETHNLEISFFKNKKSSKNRSLSITQDSSLTFATAIGLALRGIFISNL